MTLLLELTSHSYVNDVVNELFESLLLRYQDNLEISMRRSDFIFDLVTIKHFKCHRVTFKCGGSYIGSPAWLKYYKGTASPQNGENKCF